MNAQLAIFGVGGFARETAWLARKCRQADAAGPVPVCFVGLAEDIARGAVNGLDVLAAAAARQRFPDALAVCAAGEPALRARLVAEATAAGFCFATLIHPNTEYDDTTVTIQEGTVICTGGSLTTNIVVGRHVQINPGCTIGHDVILDDYASLAPGVRLSGYVHVKAGAYLGTGAVTVQGHQGRRLVIGEAAVVGAGAVVTTDVPAGATYVGIPARPIRRG